MFDWDTDYEGVVQSRALPVHDIAAPVRPASRKLLPGRWVLAGVAAIGLGLAALVAASAPSVPVVAGLLSWPSQAPVMPDGLQAYDHSQFENFHRGISRFSDADLLNYAGETERTLAGQNRMAAFTRDALFLAHREIDRRGLRRPVSSLSVAFGPS